MLQRHPSTGQPGSGGPDYDDDVDDDNDEDGDDCHTDEVDHHYQDDDCRTDGDHKYCNDRAEGDQLAKHEDDWETDLQSPTKIMITGMNDILPSTKEIFRW